MPVLTPTDLTLARNRINGNIDFTKPQVNAAIQAAEDWFETNKASLLTAINGTGHTFTAPQVRRIAKVWLEYKFGVGVT